MQTHRAVGEMMREAMIVAAIVLATQGAEPLA